MRFFGFILKNWDIVAKSIHFGFQNLLPATFSKAIRTPYLSASCFNHVFSLLKSAPRVKFYADADFGVKIFFFGMEHSGSGPGADQLSILRAAKHALHTGVSKLQHVCVEIDAPCVRCCVCAHQPQRLCIHGPQPPFVLITVRFAGWISLLL